MHEMEKMKRAHVQQVDEISIQKNLRENQETIQQLTSQLQQWQEQMNSVNSSWEFQDIESNYGGRVGLTFPLNLKWFRVLVLCSTATKDCRLIHGINPEYRKTFVGSQFSTFDSPRDFPQRISCDNVQRNREAVPLDLQPKVKTSLTSEDGQKIMVQFQCPCLRQDRWLRVLNTRVDIPQKYVVRTAKTATIGTTNRQVP